MKETIRKLSRLQISPATLKLVVQLDDDPSSITCSRIYFSPSDMRKLKITVFDYLEIASFPFECWPDPLISESGAGYLRFNEHFLPPQLKPLLSVDSFTAKVVDTEFPQVLELQLEPVFRESDLSGARRKQLRSMAVEKIRQLRFVFKDGAVSVGPDNSAIYRVVGDSLPLVFSLAREPSIRVIDSAFEERSQAAETSHRLGGMEEVAKKVKRLLGLSRGVLIIGAAGVGKTALARQVAAECSLRVIAVTAADIGGSIRGEPEQRLRSSFEEAKRCSPSCLLLDDVDGIAPKREDCTSVADRRVVATLLSLLDELRASQHSSGVKILATTSRLHAIDESLKRVGRFDAIVEIPIPVPEQRFQILKALLPADALFSDEVLLRFAMKAHGYVAADLASVCSEALEHAENRALSIEDLEVGLMRIKPSAIREIAVQVPRVRWSDIGGQSETKQRLQEAVEWPLRHPEAFQRLGISPPRGVLLYGPPGCSKTLMAKALATESSLNFIAVKGPEIFSKWVGDSERSIREVFRKARAAAPSIIFFDEIDAIAGKRASGGEGVSVQDRVLSMLLNEMDGIEALQNVTVVAATNRPDSIDPALLRPGRFDRLVYVAPPDLEGRRAILRLQRVPFAPEISLDALALETDGYSGAELVSLCQEAAIAALNRSIDCSVVERGDFEAALGRVRRGITREMLQYYERYQK